jgi:hypothetical protein
MIDIAAVADKIVALINAQPRSPTKAEIEALLNMALPSTEWHKPSGIKPVEYVVLGSGGAAGGAAGGGGGGGAC